MKSQMKLKIVNFHQNSKKKQMRKIALLQVDPLIDPTPVTKKKICRFHLQQRCKFGDRCFNIHTSQNAYPRKYVPPWKNDRYPSNYNYQSSSSYVPDLALYGGYLSQNRFQKLPLMDLDLGEHSVYWSRPYNPTLKNSSNQNFRNSLNHPNFMH